MAPKVTLMKLKVNLQCEKCYMKVKKVFSKFPQIRDQLYDEKDDIVVIKVVCCSPEKLRDRLCCQGGGSIKSIEIVEPPKPNPPQPEKPKPPGPEKPKHPPPEPRKDAAAPAPLQATPVLKFPEPTPPVPVLAYPLPHASVGPFYGGGEDRPMGSYGRPIYDSYGGSGPCCVGHYHQYLYEEDPHVCTIT